LVVAAVSSLPAHAGDDDRDDTAKASLKLAKAAGGAENSHVASPAAGDTAAPTAPDDAFMMARK